MFNDRISDLLLRLSDGCSQFLIQELFRDLEIFRIRRCAFLSLRKPLLLSLIKHLYDCDQRRRISSDSLPPEMYCTAF